MYLFTSESVSEGHPDKVCDQIADTILDNFLAQDSDSHVACEVLTTTGQVVLAGEVNSKGYVDVQRIVRDTITKIGYTKSDYMFEAQSCGVLSALHEQSPDINQGVCRADKLSQGAGDQGIIFGYATNETENYMPLTLDLAHTIMYSLAQIRKQGKEMRYLRPDAKAQVTIQYDDNHRPMAIDNMVVSTQHDPVVDQCQIKKDVIDILLPYVSKRDKAYKKLIDDFLASGKATDKLLVNPTGKFVIGGPAGDTGLTGRKIIVDTYGGRGANGGGALSGKDPSKVDRSAAYMTRYIAKNLVAAGVADELLLQVGYAIGVAQPVALFVNTYGTAHHNLTDEKIASLISQLFDLRPGAIEEQLHLRTPLYEETASYGHMGRTPKVVKKTFRGENGEVIPCEVELFPWEKLDKVQLIKDTLHI